MYLEKIFSNINHPYKKHRFSKISINSKNCSRRCIFFSIKGKNFNGNNFINEAIENGASTIISDKKFVGYKNNILYLYSSNPRVTLAKAVRNFYKKKPKKLLAVTGTNGKSSIANFYFQILNLNNIKVSSIGTLGINSNLFNIKTNNTTLDPINLNKTLLKLNNSKINNVILEASSHGLKQHRLDGLNFDIGIFSNFSRDHLDYHKSYKNYLNSKLILFKHLIKKGGLVIFDEDIKEANIIKKIIKKRRLKSLTIGNKSDLKLIDHSYIKEYQLVKFKYKKKIFSFKTKLIGKIQLKNLFMAILAASRFISINKIVNILEKIRPVNGRFEKVGKIKNHSKIILDYSHTPSALENILQNIKEQFKTSKISLVFGCGGQRDKPKRRIMGQIASRFCDRVFLTDDNPRGENPKKIRDEVKSKIDKNKLIEVPSRQKSIKLAVEKLKSGEILVIAGKGHENYQEYKTKKYFSDKLFINKYIKIKNRKLSKYWKTNIVNEYLTKYKISKSKNIQKVSTNSNEFSKNKLFVGLKGRNFDGNLFAEDAIRNKAEGALVSSYNKSKKSNVYKVKDSLKTFSSISSRIRTVSNINSIAITGSAGKTSFKNLLGNSLSKISSTYYSKSSFNNKYGVPISLFNINFKNNFGVFEVGMDKKGEISNLSRLIKPNVGIITNISYAHIKNFKNIKEIALAKSEIIDSILDNGTIILNKDDKFYFYMKNKALKNNLKVISFSKYLKSDIQLINIIKTNKKTLVKLKYKNKKIKFFINKNLIPYIENLLGVLAVLSVFFDIEKLRKNLFLNFKPTKGRGNLLKTKIRDKLINIIDESYNSNPLSLKFSLNNFNSMDTKKNKKILLLGDMLELGKHSKRLHDEIPDIINKSRINKVYVYGNYMKRVFNKIKTQKQGKILKSKIDVENLIKFEIDNKDYLMVKGSNSTGLNRIIKKFS